MCGPKLDKLPHPDEIRTIPKVNNYSTNIEWLIYLLKDLKSGTICQICTVVMSAAQNLLEQNKTEVNLRKFEFSNFLF